MNLSFRQLRTFREVMRSGSVSEAARALGRTQPAVSAMIGGLERELGFSLFERERGRLVPRPEAHYFLEEAELVLTRLSQSARVMQDIGNLEQGSLRIACNPATSGFFLPQVVARFVKDRPEVKVSIMMRSSAVIEEWIASQQYDVGLAETPAPRRSIAMQTFELRCYCALRHDDPLALLPAITPQILDGKPLAALFSEHVTYRTLAAHFAAAGATLNQRFELRTFQPALQLIEAGLCYCICDAITAASYRSYAGGREEIVFRPFEPETHLSMAILTPAHRPPSLLAQGFCDLLTSEVEALALPSAGADQDGLCAPDRGIA
ncbi:MAG: LysR substrate-binding domain-containing protein [Kiloniellales bacterium]